MSEKRFTLEQWTEKSLYFSDGEYSAHMSIEYICKKVEKKLNEQSERIKSLEMELDLIANTKLFSRRKLEEENEQMKKQLEKIPKSIRKVWLE